MPQFLDETPFEHQCKNGTTFSADRCDLRTGMRVIVPHDLPDEKLIQDTSEMIGYHALFIWHQLSSFSGYDRIHYVIERC